MPMPSIRSYVELDVNNTPNYVITKPAGTVEGDWLFYNMSYFPAARVLITVNDPPGWIPLWQGTLVGTNDRTAAYVKRAGASEGASYTWQTNGNSFGGASMVCVKDAVSYEFTTASQSNGTATSRSAGPETPVAPNALALLYANIEAAPTVTAPANYSVVFDTQFSSVTEKQWLATQQLPARASQNPTIQFGASVPALASIIFAIGQSEDTFESRSRRRSRATSW